MSRTVPVLKRSVLSGPESLDLFNILDVDPTKPCPPTPPPQEDLAGRELYDFYTDSTLLITGGTGFLGRVLLQKLLRTFAIKRIYLLVRRKDTTSVEERMNEFFQEVVSCFGTPASFVLLIDRLSPLIQSRSMTKCGPNVQTFGRKSFQLNRISRRPIWDWTDPLKRCSLQRCRYEVGEGYPK